MSRARVAVLKVISGEMPGTAAAAEYGSPRQHLHRLIARYKAGGLDAVEPRSRRPKSNPQATGDKVREFIIRTRLELTAAGSPTSTPGHWPAALTPRSSTGAA